MRNSLIATAAVASTIALSIAACGTEQPAEVVEQADQTTEATPDSTTEATPDSTTEATPDSSDIVVEGSDAPEAETEEESSGFSGTAAIGDTVVVGDEYGWEITITEVVKNANGTIAEANEFNDPAEGQYVLVTYDATYVGDSRSASPWADLNWEFVASDGVVYETSYAVTPADSEDWPQEARQGATIPVQVVFDVPKKAINGGLLSVDEWASGDYAEFPIS